MAIDKEFPVYVKGSGTKPTLWVQARDYMGPQQVTVERQNAGLVVLSLPEAQELIKVLGQAVATLQPGDQQQVKEVHNVWTIYGMADDAEAEQPIAEASRPQDWGHPRWVYHRFEYEWLSAPDGVRYINHVHCWTDLKREPHEYCEMFAPLVATIMLPGARPELCGKEFMAEEDFWDKKWGKMPPFAPDKDGEEDYE